MDRIASRRAAHLLIVRALVAGALGVASSPPTLAQSTVEVPSEPACPDCRITFEKVATLGSLEDPVTLTPFTAVVAGRDGTYYAGLRADQGEIARYDARGRYIGGIGRRGDGPGEYHTIDYLLKGPGDSLYVFEYGRYTVLTPDHEVARVRTLPGRRLRAGALPGGRVLFNANIRTRERTGLPLHILEPDGSIARSFGRALEIREWDDVWGMIRMPAYAGEGRFWVAAAGEASYRAELWDTAGRHLKTLVRQPEWYEPVGYRSYNVRRQRPTPGLSDIHVDGAGRLWVIGKAARDDWHPPAENEPIVPGYGTEAFIEVIDPATNRLIASTRFRDEPINALLDDGRVSSLYATRDGDYRIGVWRVRLVGR